MKQRILKLTLIISMFLFNFCSSKTEKETIDEFILYGYNRFCLKDSSKWIYDYTKLDIRQYFEYEKDSSIKIVKRKYDTIK